MKKLGGSLKFAKHEMLVVRDVKGTAQLWTVAGDHREGWLLEPLDGTGERRLFTHDDLFGIYVTGRLKVLNRTARELDAEEQLRVRRAWDGAPAFARAVAERRYVILRACREQRANFRSMEECFSTVPAQIVDRYGQRWDEEDRKLRAASRALDEPVPDVLAAEPDELAPRSVPKARTLWNWHRLCGGPDTDVRGLLPRWHLRGDSRPLHAADLVALMNEVIREHMLKPPPKTAKMVYKIFNGKARKLLGLPEEDSQVRTDLGTSGVLTVEIVPHVSAGDRVSITGGGMRGGTAISRPATSPKFHLNSYPSYTTFWRRIRTTVRADEFVRGQSGARAARLAYGTFDETTPPPFYLNQAESDHSFINMFVNDDASGRLLGRPWLTAIRDRKTKVILGLHVSFLPPSWMTLSRAIAHAIWPKDLSGHPGLKHDWFCHGVFDWLVTDRGTEFLGDGLRSTGRLLGFEIGNLQGFAPWLKGGLERWFRTLKGQVFAYRQGTSAWRALKHYDGRERADMTFSELKRELIRWVTDDYHHQFHESLGMTPAERWAMEEASHGPPRPVEDFHDLRRLFCKPVRCTIQSYGIEHDGLIYRCPELDRLRGRFGDGREWRVMVDPFDLRSVYLFDPGAEPCEDIWLEVPCTRPELAVNVTQHQHDLHKLLAKLTAPGEPITEAMLMRAAERAEKWLMTQAAGRPRTGTAARLARYRDDGSFLTPVRLSVPTPLVFAPTVDWGQARFDAATGASLTLVDDRRRGSAEPAGAPGSFPNEADMPVRAEDADCEALILETMKEMRR